MAVSLGCWENFAVSRKPCAPTIRPAVAPPDLAGAARLELLELLAVAGRIDELSAVGAQALDDLAHDPDLTAAVHLLMARAAVSAGVPAEAGQHLDAASRLSVLSPRRIAQVRRSKSPLRSESVKERNSGTGGNTDV